MNKIAIMTAGGDCPGLNSVIKTVVLSAIKKGISVIGIVDGYIGFVEKKYVALNEKSVEDIENIGGTILGSSNKECPFHYKNENGEYEDRVDESINNLRKLGVEGMVIIGGDGTLDSARVINERGMPCIGIPKTIDNDMVASNPTIGFDTAVQTAAEAIRKVRTTASSHRRVMVVELMGRTSGYLTLYSGITAGADIILLPEKDYNFEIVKNKVIEVMESEKRYCIIAMSEASKEKNGEEHVRKIINDSFEKKRYGGVSELLANRIEEETGYETRNVVLGHIQRGGEPTVTDIILGTKLGEYAMYLLSKGKYGYIVGALDGQCVKMEFPKERVPRLLDYDNDELVRAAKNMNICFGD